MADPPVSVDPEGVRPEARKVGTRWIDLIIASAAIILSLISLGVAIGNARTQQKMVAASTWPMPQWSSGNLDPDTGERAVIFRIVNTGAGPALVHHVELTYRGRPMKSAAEFLTACCDWAPERWRDMIRAEPAGGLMTSTVAGMVLRPGQEMVFLRMKSTEPNAPIFGKLDAARQHVVLEGCYCSVFEECWQGDLQSLRRERVERCPPSRSGGYLE